MKITNCLLRLELFLLAVLLLVSLVASALCKVPLPSVVGYCLFMIVSSMVMKSCPAVANVVSAILRRL